MHAAFGYDRRDPYSRLPIDTPPHQSSNGGVDPIVDHTVEHNVSTLVIGVFYQFNNEILLTKVQGSTAVHFKIVYIQSTHL